MLLYSDMLVFKFLLNFWLSSLMMCSMLYWYFYPKVELISSASGFFGWLSICSYCLSIASCSCNSSFIISPDSNGWSWDSFAFYNDFFYVFLPFFSDSLNFWTFYCPWASGLLLVLFLLWFCKLMHCSIGNLGALNYFDFIGLGSTAYCISRSSPFCL